MFEELRNIFKDHGVVLLAVVVPLLYPLLYSWIYTNEVTREVPLCVVDMSDSESSRQFTNKIDATPDLRVAYKCADMKEAQRHMAAQEAYGIIYFPEDYATRIARMEQATIVSYLDMTFLLYYKAIYITITNLLLESNTKIQLRLAGNITKEEERLQSSSINIREVQMYNTTGGYGNFLLQAVLALLVQQTMLISICMRAGGKRQFRHLEDRKKRKGILGEALGVFSAFGLVYLVSSAYILLAAPKIFGFTQRIGFESFLIFVIPALFAMLWFSMAASTLFKTREDSIICIVFLSVPLLFLVGISWPEVSIPPVWEHFGWLFPSTPAARAFVQLNEMGCDIEQVYPYLAALIAQGLVYMAIYFIIMGLTPIPSPSGEGGNYLKKNKSLQVGSVN